MTPFDSLLALIFIHLCLEFSHMHISSTQARSVVYLKMIGNGFWYILVVTNVAKFGMYGFYIYSDKNKK